MLKLLVVAATLWIAATAVPSNQPVQPASTQTTPQTEAPARSSPSDQDRAAWFGHAVGRILDSE